MYADINKPPAPPPTPQLQQDIIPGRPGISLLPPVLRKGTKGPGLILLVPDWPPSESQSQPPQLAIINGVPSPMLKWAEEGYTVVEIQQSAIVSVASEDDVGFDDILESALNVLQECEKCWPKGDVGLIGYVPESFSLVAPYLRCFFDSDKMSALVHSAGGGVSKPSDRKKSTLTTTAVDSIYPSVITTYHYPSQHAHFALPSHPNFDYNAESLSHTRNLAFLKEMLGPRHAPNFDLEQIWEEHCFYEFADRSVEHTMSTMVPEPYVNHVPTMTGGIGRASLTEFYRSSFIFSNSSDSALELTSRTVSVDRVVDEFVFSFTHSQKLDWLLPGIPPTHKHVEVPFTAVVNIRGDRLYHEHIAWDQGTVLRQIGLLPEWLPFPYPVEGKEEGKKLEYRVPVGGQEVAQKMRDRNSVPSNEMFGFEVREVSSE